MWCAHVCQAVSKCGLSIRGSGLGSNTFYQIQIQIQKFGFFKYKYKYFLKLWFKYKYKYINSNTNTNSFNQIYQPKLVIIQYRAILYSIDPQDIYMLMACVSLCLDDTWSLPLCISGNFTGTRAVVGGCWIGMLSTTRSQIQKVEYDDVIKWKHFPRYWSFVRGEFPGHRWDPLTKANDADLWCFLWSGPE